MFVQPMCQGPTGNGPADYDSCSTDARPPLGPEALTPKDQVIRTNFFAAPFAYL